MTADRRSQALLHRQLALLDRMDAFAERTNPPVSSTVRVTGPAWSSELAMATSP